MIGSFVVHEGVHLQLVHELVEFQRVNPGTKVKIECFRPIRFEGRPLRPETLAQEVVDHPLQGSPGRTPPLGDFIGDIGFDGEGCPHQEIMASG